MADVTTITVYSRDAHRRRYLRSYSLRAPGVDVGDNSEPAVAAAAHADSMMVVYNTAVIVNSNTNLIGSTGQALLDKARAQGIEGKLPAVGSEGFVIIAAGATGGQIDEGTVLRYTPAKLRFRVKVSDVYKSGELCPVQGIDVGESTNLPKGSTLEWESPPPGILPTAVVADDGDGNGLTGGRPEETDEELVERIVELRKNPPASGNDAEYRKAARETPGLAVQVAFAWDAPFGPGTIAVGCTLRQPFPGASRVPNAVQLATMEGHLKNSGFPASDGLFTVLFQEVPVSVYLGVTWTKQAKGFVDGTSAWPPYNSVGPIMVDVAGPPTPTSFTLVSTSSNNTAPKVGQTIAFFNAGARKFVQKKILTVVTVVPNQKWTITCDITANASDTGYTPVAGQVACPWSPSMTQLVLPLLDYFDKLGPGEMFGTFYDEGARQKRQPESPDEWPSIISSRDLGNTPPRALVSDVLIYEPTPNGVTKVPDVGVPGVMVNLFVLGDFGIFPFPSLA